MYIAKSAWSHWLRPNAICTKSQQPIHENSTRHEVLLPLTDGTPYWHVALLLDGELLVELRVMHTCQKDTDLVPAAMAYPHSGNFYCLDMTVSSAAHEHA
jgi:hypothetical protein